MKPLFLNFYHLHDITAADGKTILYERFTTVKPLDSIKVRAEVVLRAHLSYVGFVISRFRPALENTTLEADLHFKESGGKVMPILTASHQGVLVAQKEISTQTIDAQPFMADLIKRIPALENAVLTYTISNNNGRNTS